MSLIRCLPFLLLLPSPDSTAHRSSVKPSPCCSQDSQCSWVRHCNLCCDVLYCAEVCCVGTVTLITPSTSTCLALSYSARQCNSCSTLPYSPPLHKYLHLNLLLSLCCFPLLLLPQPCKCTAAVWCRKLWSTYPLSA